MFHSETFWEEKPDVNENKTILFSEKNETQRWLHVLLNFCAAPLYLINLNMAPGIFSALSQANLHIVQPFSARRPETQIAGALADVDIYDYHKAVDSILSSVRLLLASSANVQADLFMAPIGKDFISVWQLEKERLKALPVSLSEANQKAFAVTRFLIKRGLVGASKALTNLLQTAFIHTIGQLLKKQRNQDFVALFQKNLRALYSDLYMVEKLRSLSAGLAKRWMYYNDITEITLSDARSIIFQPQDGYAPKKNKTEIQLARLFGPDDIKETQPGFDEEAIWHDEIGMQSPQLRKTGRAGKYLFNRLFTQNLKKEATTLFWHWQQVDRFLQMPEFVGIQDVRLCLVLPVFKINERSVSVREIILEQLKSNKSHYPFKLVRDFISDRLVDIIILEKKKEEQ